MVARASCPAWKLLLQRFALLVGCNASDAKHVTSNSYLPNKSEEMIHDRLKCDAAPLVITLLSLEPDCLVFFQVLVPGSIEVSVGCSCQLLNRTHKLMILVLSENVRKTVKKSQRSQSVNPWAPLSQREATAAC